MGERWEQNDGGRNLLVEVFLKLERVMSGVDGKDDRVGQTECLQTEVLCNCHLRTHKTLTILMEGMAQLTWRWKPGSPYTSCHL